MHLILCNLPSTSTSIYQNYPYNSNEPVFSPPNKQNFQQSTIDQQLREKDAYIHQLHLLIKQAQKWNTSTQDAMQEKWWS